MVLDPGGARTTAEAGGAAGAGARGGAGDMVVSGAGARGRENAAGMQQRRLLPRAVEQGEKEYKQINIKKQFMLI